VNVTGMELEYKEIFKELIIGIEKQEVLKK